MLRSLNSDDGSDCQSAGLFDTTFNEAPGSYLFSGIMFSVRTKHTPIRIETLEIDVDAERGSFGSTPNLEMEIFTYKGQYAGVMSNPSDWTLVAKTTPVKIDSRQGVLVPVNDFEGVQMEANEFRSFYISMKGKYLDSRANGLDKPGDLDQEFGDLLTLFTGTGLQSRFAEDADRTVAPKFTGQIHYTEQSACGSTSISVKKSVIEFQFDIETTDVDDTITRSDEVLDSYLQRQLSDGILSEFVEKYSLVLVGDLYTTGFSRDGVCRFDPCTRIKTGLTLEHLSLLDRDHLEATVLEDVNTIATELRSALGLPVEYSGSRASSATFDLVVSGIPAHAKMNDAQIEYFESIVSAYVDSTAIKVYDFTVSEQKLLDKNQLRVSGEIYGASTSYDQDGFASAVEGILREGESGLIAELKLQYLLTPRLHAADSVFFSGLTNAEANLEAVWSATIGPSVSPTPAPIIKTNVAQGSISAIKDRAQDASVNKPVLVTAIVAGIIVGVGMLWLFCRRRSFDRLRYKKSKQSGKSDDEPILPSPRRGEPTRGRSASTASVRSESPPESPRRLNVSVVHPRSPTKRNCSSDSLDFGSFNGRASPSQSQRVSASTNAPSSLNLASSRKPPHRSMSFDSSNRPRFASSQAHSFDDRRAQHENTRPPSRSPSAYSEHSFQSPLKPLARTALTQKRSPESFRSQSQRPARSIDPIQPTSPRQSFRSQSQRLSRSNESLPPIQPSNESFRSQSHRPTRSDEQPLPVRTSSESYRSQSPRAKSFDQNTFYVAPAQDSTNPRNRHHSREVSCEGSAPKAAMVPPIRSPVKMTSQRSTIAPTPESTRKPLTVSRPSPIHRASSDGYCPQSKKAAPLVRAQSSISHMSPQQRQRTVPASPRKGVVQNANAIPSQGTLSPQREHAHRINSIGSQRLASPRRGNVQRINSTSSQNGQVFIERGNVQRTSSIGSQKLQAPQQRGNVQRTSSIGSQKLQAPQQRGNLQRINSIRKRDNSNPMANTGGAVSIVDASSKSSTHRSPSVQPKRMNSQSFTVPVKGPARGMQRPTSLDGYQS